MQLRMGGKLGEAMKIKFINHACFTIEHNEEMIMFDPWFFGKVFNSSWSLIRETNIENLELNNLKYILITHEHPDHLHWPTLEQIKDSTKHDVRIIVPKRNNKNVTKHLIQLGYKVAEIPNGKQFSISKNFKITNFVTGHDSAYVVQVGGKTILNQNDCKLSSHQVSQISNNYPDIDYYFMQFSLAGFYANKTEKEKLLKAKKDHKQMIEEYRKHFNPKMTIPFASYVYFCRQENKFLNDYIVDLGELSETYQLVSYGDEILDTNFLSRNKQNSKKWKDNLKNLQIDETKKVDDEELVNNIKRFLENTKLAGTPSKTIFSFYDNERNLMIDYDFKECYFVEDSENKVAKVTMYDLNCFFKFPWGADTMNITSCFEVYNKDLWKANLIFKDRQYKR